MHCPAVCPSCKPRPLVLLCAHRLWRHRNGASFAQERGTRCPGPTDSGDRHHRDSDDRSLRRVDSGEQLRNVQVLRPHRHLSHRRALASVREWKAQLQCLAEDGDHYEGFEGHAGRHLHLRAFVVTSPDHQQLRFLAAGSGSLRGESPDPAPLIRNNPRGAGARRSSDSRDQVVVDPRSRYWLQRARASVSPRPAHRLDRCSRHRSD